MRTLLRSFFGGYASMDLRLVDVVLCMAITVIITFYIFCIYRYISKRSFYNRNFNLSLIAIAVVTAAIILTIQSSIVVSLGMVGALSIVRFRTAIKDPLDLVFLFWSISVGIICGAGYALIAIIASIVITIIILLVRKSSVTSNVRLLLVNSNNYQDESIIEETIKKICDTHEVKARNLTKEGINLAIEVMTQHEDVLVRELMDIPNVTSASLVSHNGDVTV